MLVLPTSPASAATTLANALLAQGTLETMVGFLLSSNPPLPQLVSPTQFTQDIATKAIHSHNDYWRKVPLLTALAVGATSTEADLWLIDDTLFVGHTRSSLTPARTFESLYLGKPPSPQPGSKSFF
ncbi:hypothetical protein RQP46_002918 [Phenoliferia psychrophenolica]